MRRGALCPLGLQYSGKEQKTKFNIFCHVGDKRIKLF